MALSNLSFYWDVNGSIAGSSTVWSATDGAYVSTANTDYVAWVALGNTATVIGTEVLLWDVLSNIALSIYLAGQGYGSEILDGTTNPVLTNPLKDLYYFGPNVGGRSVTLPIMNVPTSRPIGVCFRIFNTTGSTSFTVKLSDGSIIATVNPLMYATLENTFFGSQIGNFDVSYGSSDVNYYDPDGALTSNSDSKVATQKAVKTYADTKQPLDADLTTLAALGNWKIAYTSGSSAQTALALGAANTFLRGNGVSAAPTFTAFGTNVAAFLDTPSSANLAAAVTDETGTGNLVFSNNATLVTPALGTPASGVGTNLTGIPNSALVGASTSYTPTITAGSGTFTSVTPVGGWYFQFGKFVIGGADALIATVGTASVSIIFSLPVASKTLTSGALFVCGGAEDTNTGKGLRLIHLSATTVQAKYYDNSDPIAVNNRFRIGFVYEAA